MWGEKKQKQNKTNSATNIFLDLIQHLLQILHQEIKDVGLNEKVHLDDLDVYLDLLDM